MMGKLFARILNDQLQAVVEDFVTDSHCGFRLVGVVVSFLC